MPDLTYAELFAGAGGMSLGLEAAGWRCVAHAEIEPHARAVLRKHWPEVPLYGDVTQLNGADFRGITMLTGGSPCQDLSIAGKRQGMTEGSGTRSSLFFEQVRIWRESEAPLLLWENVMGAFSSNGGQDFGAVLSTIVGGAVAVPADGWRNAGVASGPAGVAAWRAVDLQHFGWNGNTTPQRRRRVFVLGVRAGVCDPAEVLFVRDGLLGHLATSGEAWEGTAEDAPAGIAATLRGFGHGWQGQHNSTHAVGASNTGAGVAGAGKRTLTFQASGDIDNRSISVFDEMHPTLRTSQNSDGGVGVLTYDARGNGEGVSDNTLSGDHQNRVTDYTALVLRNREGKPGGGKGPLVSEGKRLTLGTTNDQVVFPTLSMGAHTAAPGSNGQDAEQIQSALMRSGAGVPRRLMPVECERLMGWPDQHTALGIDEQGREYALSDTARYKLCGNGIGSPVTAWIGMRLKEVLDNRKAH